jgi:transposase
MNANDLLTLGLGLTGPWKVVGQALDLEKQPSELRLEVEADRGSMYPCPECQALCKAHDFKDLTWRHLNFFQHHCLIRARVPRVKCPEHGVHRVNVPWARPGSGFTLLFEQVIMTLAREMPVATIARFVGTTDTRLWRVIGHYVTQAMRHIDLSGQEAFGLDETAGKRGHRYVTVFIDMDRDARPVVFAVEGKGKEAVRLLQKAPASQWRRARARPGGGERHVRQLCVRRARALQKRGSNRGLVSCGAAVYESRG